MDDWSPSLGVRVYNSNVPGVDLWIKFLSNHEREEWLGSNQFTRNGSDSRRRVRDKRTTLEVKREGEKHPSALPTVSSVHAQVGEIPWCLSDEAYRPGEVVIIAKAESRCELVCVEGEGASYEFVLDGLPVKPGSSCQLPNGQQLVIGKKERGSKVTIVDAKGQKHLRSLKVHIRYVLMGGRFRAVAS